MGLWGQTHAVSRRTRDTGEHLGGPAIIDSPVSGFIAIQQLTWHNLDAVYSLAPSLGTLLSHRVAAR